MNRKTLLPIVLTLIVLFILPLTTFGVGTFAAEPKAEGTHITTVKSPPADRSNKHYVSNREPLRPSPFVKLPIGSITPKGWLRHTLETEAQGMVGHLEEISRWCKFEDSAWVTKDGTGKNPWEEMPYWLKGYGDLGYVLKDERIIAEAKRWIDGILSSQREDGWFGPRELLTRVDGKPDLWPPMLALNVLQSWHEYTGDPRVLPFMANYFRWELNCPEQDFLVPKSYWPVMRAGDNLESVYWLYNRTGERWLLDLAEKLHRHTARWDTGVINPHGVNITQGFREPAIWWMQAKDDKFLKATYANYDWVREHYGQMPGGMFVADENFRPEYPHRGDPRGAAETCSMVEFMHSFEMLTKITGDPVWSDRCEDVAFNSLPAASTPDQRALHYLTACNQIQLDRHDKTPGIQNGGTMFSYSPFEVYRCCQHNVSHGWPYFAEELWLATADNGLCASLYSASTVKAKVGEAGVEVTVAEETNYPFHDTIKLKITAANPVRFPLYLRVPHWCEQPEVKVNGGAIGVEGKPQSYLAIDREWKDGDDVRLKLPMEVRVRQWKQNQNAVSVDHGPLTYSLKIDEQWKSYGGRGEWKEFEVFPAKPWNYGLMLDSNLNASLFEVFNPGEDERIPDNPWSPETVPINIQGVAAKRIPNWTTDSKGLVQPLQPSRVKVPSNQAEEWITLIPMGAARLRITVFPLIARAGNPDAREWEKPKEPPRASHVFSNDTTEALNDGKEPKDSNDHAIPRFTWWDHKGTAEWVQYGFEQPKKLAAAGVYWFDDRATNGGCRVPASWELLYQGADGAWKPVKTKGGYGTERDTFNRVTFEPVETKALRLQVQLQPGYSGGILEWRVE
jgi:hypothetical protein